MTRLRLAAGLLIVFGVVLAVVLPGWMKGTTAPSEVDTGWIGSVTVAYAQQSGARIVLPASFADADLLVAVVANDGPDSDTTPTHAVFGGTAGLTWTQHAHVSAHQDWTVPGDQVDRAGASSAEVWTATPLPGWSSGTVTEISNFPETTSPARDDGGVVTIAAWSSGRLGQILTVDGLSTRPERQVVDTVGPAGSIYAAVFNGRANAAFVPLPGFHTAAGIVRRLGDDTGEVIASDKRNLPAGMYTVGYASSPAPGDYWEMAIVDVVPA